MIPRLPTTKNEVVELITEARAALEVVIAETPADRREEPLSSGLSVKDMLAHITFWERSLLDRLEASATGGDFAALPYEIDADVDAINARVHAQHRSHSWDVLRPTTPSTRKPSPCCRAPIPTNRRACGCCRRWMHG
jgi:hypothetical protein